MMKTKIIVFLYLIVGLVPYLGAADKVDTQNLYLSILNLVNTFLIISDNQKNIFSQLKKSQSNLPFIFMGLFFLWSIFTIIPAINKAELLIALSEMFTILMALFFLIYHFNKIDKKELIKFIGKIIIFLTSIELISVLSPYFIDIFLNDGPKFQSIEYRGITGNINIMSYSLLLKLPFLLYYFYKRKYSVYYLFILITLISFTILSVLETRSAIISLILISLMTSSFIFIQKRDNKFKILKILFPVILGFIFTSIQNNLIEDKSTVQDRIGTLTNIENDQSINQRLRYYKSTFNSF